MKTLTTSSPPFRPASSSFSTAGLLGHVMILASLALGFAAIGAHLGRGLTPGAAIVASFVALGMLIVQVFGGERYRVGPLAVGWLVAVGLVLGLGLGPVLVFYASPTRPRFSVPAWRPRWSTLPLASAGSMANR